MTKANNKKGYLQNRQPFSIVFSVIKENAESSTVINHTQGI